MSRAAHRVKTSTHVVPVAGPYVVYQRRLVTQESRSVQRRILPLSEQDTPGLLQALARVPDPRDAGGRIHPLPGLLAIAAVVSGSSRVVEIIEWAATGDLVATLAVTRRHDLTDAAVAAARRTGSAERRGTRIAGSGRRSGPKMVGSPLIAIDRRAPHRVIRRPGMPGSLSAPPRCRPRRWRSPAATRDRPGCVAPTPASLHRPG